MADLNRFVSKEDVEEGVIGKIKEKIEIASDLIDEHKGGKVIEYDDSLNVLSLINGDDVVSEVELDVSGGGLRPNPPASTQVSIFDSAVVVKCTPNTDSIVVNGQVLAEYGGVAIIRKAGSPPENYKDGVEVARWTTGERKVIIDPATNGIDYYYGFFQFSKRNVYNYGTCLKMKPSEAVPGTISNVVITESDESIGLSCDISDTVWIYRGNEIDSSYIPVAKLKASILTSEGSVIETKIVSGEDFKFEVWFNGLENDINYKLQYQSMVVNESTTIHIERYGEVTEGTVTPKDVSTYYTYYNDGSGHYVINGVDVDRVVEDSVTDIEIPTTRNGKPVIIS